MNKAVFADLDGTLVRSKSGKKYPENTDDWILDLTLLDAIYAYMFRNLSGTLCIISNEEGVEAGMVTRDNVMARLTKIKNAIADYFLDKYSYNLKIDFAASFTNDPTDFMRKPNPGLGYKLAIANNLILSQCIMIGDSSGREDDSSDIDEGFASNCVMNYFDVENFVMFYSPNEIYRNPIKNEFI